MRKATRHPVTVKLDFNDHAAMAAWWGDECLRAMVRAAASTDETTYELEELHAWRSAKMAWWHVCKGTPYKNGRVPNERAGSD